MHDKKALGLVPGAPLYTSGRAKARARAASQGTLDQAKEPYLAGPRHRRDWNLGSHSVDTTNKQAFCYEWNRRCSQWKAAWRIHIITGIASTQVCALQNIWRQENRLQPLEQLKAITSWCHALYPPDSMSAKPCANGSGSHLPIHVLDYEEDFGLPLPHGTAKTPRTCKYKGCRRSQNKTPYACDTCGVNLHPAPCFKMYDHKKWIFHACT